MYSMLKGTCCSSQAHEWNMMILRCFLIGIPCLSVCSFHSKIHEHIQEVFDCNIRMSCKELCPIIWWGWRVETCCARPTRHLKIILITAYPAQMVETLSGARSNGMATPSCYSSNMICSPRDCPEVIILCWQSYWSLSSRNFLESCSIYLSHLEGLRFIFMISLLKSCSAALRIIVNWDSLEDACPTFG